MAVDQVLSGERISLPRCFAMAQEAVHSSDGPSMQGLMAAERAVRETEVQGMFSANEDLEDIQTSSLCYLMLEFFKGELLARACASERSSALPQALTAYGRYLRRCKTLHLLPPTMRLQAELAESPAALREQKVARFRESKRIRSKLGAAGSGRQVADPCEIDDSGFDEEAAREYWIARIELACLQAADQMQGLEQERQMLQHAASLKTGQAADGAAQQVLAPRQPPEDLMAQLRLAASNLEAPRARAATDVFRPSHILPTRSLHEQADIEMERARAAAASQDRAAQRAGAESDEDEDAWVQRQRANDDWKDDHPTGWGNSKLRPCA